MSHNNPLDLILSIYRYTGNEIENNSINNEVRLFNNMNRIIDNTIDSYLENMYDRVFEEQERNIEMDNDEEYEEYEHYEENRNYMGIFMYEEHDHRMEDRIMSIAMEESLNHYKTQEKKPNIKLNIKSKKATANLVQEKCAICTSEFEIDENVTFLTCSHVLHTECIDEWVMYKSECPICRGKIDTSNTK
jgi:flagellar biosynthesis/type III secretory pathway M-ring protein FliF/YscJ